ncbi:MAG: hypothetical protein IPH52_04235 [Leptospiraceae bacterium]|nr:hypothetical protein [Leptospiraceae bacterium]
MITDTEIKSQGMKLLVKNLGIVEAERFVALIQREPFDYTEWKQNHWKDKTVKEIHKEATDFRKQKRATAKKKVVK